MNWWKLLRAVVQLFLMIVTVVLMLTGFCIGYVKIGDLNGLVEGSSPFAQQASSIFALASAIAWGWSVLGGVRWNARFNLAAAWVLAVSVGYFTRDHLFPYLDPCCGPVSSLGRRMVAHFRAAPVDGETPLRPPVDTPGR